MKIMENVEDNITRHHSPSWPFSFFGKILHTNMPQESIWMYGSPLKLPKVKNLSLFQFVSIGVEIVSHVKDALGIDLT